MNYPEHRTDRLNNMGILQLPVYDLVTDMDDLILNSRGLGRGYSLYVLVKKVGKGHGGWRMDK